VATKLPISERMLALLKMGLDVGLESSPTRNGLRSALGRALLAAYLFESRQSQEAGNVSRGLLRTRTFIHEHFSEDITLARLGEIAAMTPNHLVAAFGRKFGATPMRYLWKQRAAHAAHLLVHSGMTGSEIAYACGYKSPYHFSRHIRAVYDKSPTEIRQQKGFRAPSNTLADVHDIAFNR
jgi:AraC-like DNA-binding protein